jgi:hypothetical protein
MHESCTEETQERFNTASVGTELPLFLVHEPPILVQRYCNGNAVLAGWVISKYVGNYHWGAVTLVDFYICGHNDPSLTP